MSVVIVTDSTAYIPAELIQPLPVEVVPLQVIWGNETFRDGVDLQPDEFYTRLQSAAVMPTTSQPSPAAFYEVYRNLLEQGHEILSVHISAYLSGTFDSATQARQRFPGQRIELVDTNTTSMAMGFQVLAAARAAKQGATLTECKAIVEAGQGHTGVLFAVNTLEFLKRGGRIGGAAAFLGTVLNLKPLLELRDGRIEAVERVRTMSKAMDRLLDLFEAQVLAQHNTPNSASLRIAAVHASAPEEAAQLLERAHKRLGLHEGADMIVAPVSPVIGTHVGPGCIGLAFLS